MDAPLASLSLDHLTTRRRALQCTLAAQPGLQPLRIAILGGSTTQELAGLLTLYLLESGFAPTFYQSEYGRFEVEALHDSAALEAFRPDIVYLHTTVLNLRHMPPAEACEATANAAVAEEVARFESIWVALDAKLGCTIIQNNFDLPADSLLGNLDAVAPGGRTASSWSSTSAWPKQPRAANPSSSRMSSQSPRASASPAGLSPAASSATNSPVRPKAAAPWPSHSPPLSAPASARQKRSSSSTSTTPSGAASSATTASKTSASAKSLPPPRHSPPSSNSACACATAAFSSPSAPRTMKPRPNPASPTPTPSSNLNTSRPSKPTGSPSTKTSSPSRASSTSAPTPSSSQTTTPPSARSSAPSSPPSPSPNSPRM